MGRDHPAPNTMYAMTKQCVGYGGTAPSPSLELLDVATAMPSKLRDPRLARVPLWGRGTVTRPAVLLPRAARGLRARDSRLARRMHRNGSAFGE